MQQDENSELGEYIFALVRKDEHAIDEIYKRVGNLMYSVASLYLSNYADIEEVIQEALFKISRKAKHYKENNNAQAWIVVIVKNEAKNRLRKLNRYKEVGIETLNTALYVEINEDKILADEILSSLSEQEKDLIIYYYWMGMSLAEIAKVFHKPKPTIVYKMRELEDKIRNFCEK